MCEKVDQHLHENESQIEKNREKAEVQRKYYESLKVKIKNKTKDRKS